VDTGHPDGGWTEQARTELLEHVLPYTDIFLPNESELCGLTGIVDVEDAVRDLAAHTGAMIVAKLGADGALLCTGGEPERARAAQVVPVDTTGAGDSFNAAFPGALTRGRSAGADLELAVATASELVAPPPEARPERVRAAGLRSAALRSTGRRARPPRSGRVQGPVASRHDPAPAPGVATKPPCDQKGERVTS